jgi:hypothetical protein
MIEPIDDLEDRNLKDGSSRSGSRGNGSGTDDGPRGLSGPSGPNIFISSGRSGDDGPRRFSRPSGPKKSVSTASVCAPIEFGSSGFSGHSSGFIGGTNGFDFGAFGSIFSRTTGLSRFVNRPSGFGLTGLSSFPGLRGFP